MEKTQGSGLSPYGCAMDLAENKAMPVLVVLSSGTNRSMNNTTGPSKQQDMSHMCTLPYRGAYHLSAVTRSEPHRFEAQRFSGLGISCVLDPTRCYLLEVHYFSSCYMGCLFTATWRGAKCF